MQPIHSEINPAALTPTQKFLMWSPFIGPNIKLVKQIKQQLKQRTCFPKEQWNGHRDIDSIVEFSKKLKEANEWPNHYFHPDDPIDLLFFFTDGDGWEAIDIMMEWEKEHNSEFPLHQGRLYSELFEACPNQQNLIHL